MMLSAPHLRSIIGTLFPTLVMTTAAVDSSLAALSTILAGDHWHACTACNKKLITRCPAHFFGAILPRGRRELYSSVQAGRGGQCWERTVWRLEGVPV